MKASIVIKIDATPEKLMEVASYLAGIGIQIEGASVPIAKAGPVNKEKARCKSEKEMAAYFAEQGLHVSDATYFWNKMLSSDWSIGGRPVRDWRAAVRTWKAGAFFPSQKGEWGSTNRAAKEQAAKEIARLREDFKYLSPGSGEDRLDQIRSRISMLCKQFGLS